jgi:hypothetical protein
MKMQSMPALDTPNEMGHRILPGMESQVLSESITLSRNPIVTFDPDMYWEMNYHEAAIFLEVI